MSRQSESEGSSDGAVEGEAGERGTAEDCAVSVEGIRNLVSGGYVRRAYIVCNRLGIGGNNIGKQVANQKYI
jgi:hypothetical protein